MRLSVLVTQAKWVARTIRRVFRLSPMCSVIRELRGRGIIVSELDALECFAFTGDMHTRDYASSVRSLELWEIHSGHERSLRGKFPGSVVRITDTYDEIRRASRKFGFVVVDNSPLHGGHVEHFDLFPTIFTVLRDRAVMVLDVIPDLNSVVRKHYPEMFRESTLEARQRFYNARDPRHVFRGEMLAAYTARCEAAGFHVEASFFRKRNNILTYLVLLLERVAVGSEIEEIQPAMTTLTRP